MAERSAKQLGLSQADLPNSVLEVIATLSKSGFEAYLVGGGVRDTLLGLNPKDFDAVTNAKPHEIKDLFGKRCRIIGRRFQLAHVYSGRDMIEVATFRAPPLGNAHTNSEGMIVRDNVWGDIEQDFARRDFTINALYYQPIKGVVHDFCNALGDIKSKTLSLLGKAAVRIEEDPVRLLRALRFKAKLGFEFDGDLATQFNNKNWALLEQVSPHRLYDESQKMFTGGYLVPLLPLLFEYGAIEHLFIYPPKAPTALVTQVAINTDKRIAMGKSINPAFFYAALLWDNYLYQLAKFKKKNLPFQDAQLKAAATVIDRQRIKTAIPRFAEQFIRDIWMLQPKLANPRAKQIYQLADHPRFRAGFDFLLLREQCNDAANPLSESTNDMGEWWQTYQTLSEKQKQQAVSDFDDAQGTKTRGRGRNRKRRRSNDVEDDASYGSDTGKSDISSDNEMDNRGDNTDTQSQNNQKPLVKGSEVEQAVVPQKSGNVSTKTHSSKAQNKPKKSKRTMSRPQRAHYNREREQLRKLSLELTSKSKNEVNSEGVQQPKPLFTIDADKLAKQVPQIIAAQTSQAVMQEQDEQAQAGDASATKHQSIDLQDDASNVQAVANALNSDTPQTAKSKSTETISTEITSTESTSTESTSKDALSAESKASKSEANKSEAKRATQPSTQSSVEDTGKSKAVRSTAKKGPIPNKRRRRQPSSTVTQIELLTQKSQQSNSKSVQIDSDTKTPAELSNVAATPKLDNEQERVTSPKARKPRAIKKPAVVDTDNSSNVVVTNAVAPTATTSATRRGRIPAIRRRREPSSTITVRQRQQAES